MKINRLVFKAIIIMVLIAGVAWAKGADWQRQEVNWRLNYGSKIRAIFYPQQIKSKLFKKDKSTPVKKSRISEDSVLGKLQQLAGSNFAANIVEAPPIAGFVPYLTVTVTDQRNGDDDLVAVPYETIGSFLTQNPESDFGIGILDTGASILVISADAAETTGLYDSPLITVSTTEITGVTGSVFVSVSEPLGVFFDGLASIDPCSKEIDPNGLLGEYNISVAIAPFYEPNVPTAIGSPFAVYYTAVIDNSNVVTIDVNGVEYSGPSVRFYDHFDPCIPEYPNKIPLELRPLGALNVQYAPTLDPEDPFFGLIPQSPSTIVGNLSQSLFFIPSADIYEGNYSAIDRDRFMLDTGAQVSVIGSRIASRLHINPNYPEFLVEVTGIDGQTIEVPGFIIDRIVIPTLGDWFIATDVPVIYLDVYSPEGGTLDGIIGMNLFTQFNMVLRGGGLFLQEDPALELQPLNWLAGDIVPEGGDGVVDHLDLQAFVLAWLSEGTIPPSPNWNPKADLAPPNSPDNIVNFLDFAVLAEHWLEQITP